MIYIAGPHPHSRLIQICPRPVSQASPIRTSEATSLCTGGRATALTPPARACVKEYEAGAE